LGITIPSYNPPGVATGDRRPQKIFTKSFGMWIQIPRSLLSIRSARSPGTLRVLSTRSSGAVRGKRTGAKLHPQKLNLGSDSPIPTLNLLRPIARYLKGTILLDESYIRILLVCFVGTTRSSGAVRGKRTGSPPPKKYLQNSLEFGVSPIRLLGVHFEALCFLFLIPTCFFYHLLPYFTSQKECIPFLQL
jgi:hypothetical protein